MRKKELNKFKLFTVILILILIVLILTIILLRMVDKSQQNLEQNQISLEIQKQEEAELKNIENDVIIKKLAEMGERDRIEYYFSLFIKAIESKNYEKAYNMLYNEFKDNYFTKYSDFEAYAKKTFPKTMSVKHTNFERNGNVYVLFVTISDMLSSKKQEGKEMKFIVREDSINNFVMSFSVI